MLVFIVYCMPYLLFDIEVIYVLYACARGVKTPYSS